LEQLIKNFVDALADPIVYFLGSALAIVAFCIWRRFLTRPIVITVFFALSVAFLVFAWDDPNFNKIITKGDNIPILILLASVIFFTWLGMRRAVINDERTAKGEPTLEGELARQKVFTWPDLVYTEFICLILFTALLIVWSIVVEAPLEEPAATARTPNPSKAPWYFLGLQELLVYFDPWIAGVLLPSFIIVGLMAIPYVDTNPKGNGYYTFNERKFAVSFFYAGFVLFWVSFVILGTFLRGPNWSFFGPFEYWDLHKLEPMVNVDLSTFFWVKGLGTPRPDNPLIRELPGLLFLGGYFLVGPLVLAKTVCKKLFEQMGQMRYQTMMHMLLWFGLVPIKMFSRWIFDLKYFVGMPEYFFNI
jgi:hypothetical protein